jgi:hypothetical protein
MKSNLPALIYKYTKLNQHFYDMLIRRELWFTSPSLFNDPFDCSMPIDFYITEEEACKSFINRARLIYPNYGVTDDESPITAVKQLLEYVNSVRSVLGVFCCSAEKDDLIMWAHYADSHKGVQICFDVNELSKGNFAIQTVKYSNGRPTVDHDMIDSMMSTILHKSKDWQREKEVRLIKQSPGYYPFEKKAIKEIRFGLRCSDDEISTTQQLLKTSGFEHVRCSQAIVVKNKFKLGTKAWGK